MADKRKELVLLLQKWGIQKKGVAASMGITPELMSYYLTRKEPLSVEMEADVEEFLEDLIADCQEWLEKKPSRSRNPARAAAS